MLGIFLAEKLAIHHESLNYGLFFLFACIFYFKRSLQTHSKRWVSGLFLYFFLFLLGYQITYYQRDTILPNHFQNQIQQKNFIIGTVENMPVIKKNKIKIILRTQSIGLDQQALVPCEGKILAYLNNYENAPKINYGDQLLIKSKIVPTSKATNPNAFDYSEYLRLQNIHFQIFSYQKNWKMLASKKGNPFWQPINKLRKQFLVVLKKHITSEKELAIATALILGDRNQLSQELKSAYAESGAIHVLAVSGLHIGIINGFLLFLLQLLPFKNQHWNKIKLGITLLAIWFFALLSGMSVSVQRAAIMFSVFNFGYVIQRDINIYNSLALAAFYILIKNPYALFDVGFQFSFIAVIGILFFLPKLKQFWLPKNKWLSQIWMLILVSVSAQFALFPLILYYFHEVPTYFWLSSVFVIPLAGLIMKLGVFLLILNSFSELLASYLGVLISKIIACQNSLISLVQELPFHLFSGFWISQLEVILLYGFILGIAMLLLTYKPRWIFSALSCLVLVSCVQFSKELHQEQQKKIVIYAIAKNSVIDFIDGTTIYSLEKEKLTESQLTYSVQNNRWASKANKIIPINKYEIQTQNLFKQGNLLKFHDKKIALIDKELPKNLSVKNRLDFDYLILQNNPKINITELAQYYNFKELIFDASNSFWTIKNWKKTCELEGITFRDIRIEGAYVIDLNQNEQEKLDNLNAMAFKKEDRL